MMIYRERALCPLASFLFMALMSLVGSGLAAGEPSPSGAADGQGDRVVFGSFSFQEAALPRGPLVGEPFALSDGVDALAFSPDGRLLGLRQVVHPEEVTELLVIDEDGEPSVIGAVSLEHEERPQDLAFDARGRLFLATWWYPSSTSVPRLLELDAATGAVLSAVELDEHILALAPAPEGLWAVGFDKIFHLFPSVGLLIDTGASLPNPFSPHSADTDSTGALWISMSQGNVSPPEYLLWRFDPGSDMAVTLSPVRVAPVLAIRRQCQETATARCLLGGRFRAEVLWLDGEVADEGHPSLSRSADSSLFWFFSPANWEVLVKVLDGCEENGHFWVFTAAATDIVHVVEITDLETGQTQVYRHRGGGPSTAVTDNQAFATCP